MWIQILVHVQLLLVLWLLLLAAGCFTRSHINPAHASIQFPLCCYRTSGWIRWWDFNSFWETLRALRWKRSAMLVTQKGNNMCLLDQFAVRVSWVQSGSMTWLWTLEKLYASIPWWISFTSFKPLCTAAKWFDESQPPEEKGKRLLLKKKQLTK